MRLERTGEQRGGKWKWICRNAVMVQVLALTATKTLPVLNTHDNISTVKSGYIRFNEIKIIKAINN